MTVYHITIRVQDLVWMITTHDRDLLLTWIFSTLEFMTLRYAKYNPTAEVTFTMFEFAV